VRQNVIAKQITNVNKQVKSECRNASSHLSPHTLR
jgi:hypothetical protein